MTSAGERTERILRSHSLRATKAQHTQYNADEMRDELRMAFLVFFDDDEFLFPWNKQEKT